MNIYMYNNSKGYQNKFKCEVCGEYFTLSETHYFDYDGGFRVCDKCFDQYKKDRASKIKEENIAIIEEMLELRKELRKENNAKNLLNK